MGKIRIFKPWDSGDMDCLFMPFRRWMGKTKYWSAFERGMVVDARRTGLSVSRTETLLCFSRSTVSRVYQEWRQSSLCDSCFSLVHLFCSALIFLLLLFNKLTSPSTCFSAAYCFTLNTSMSSAWLLSVERTRAVKSCTLSAISLAAMLLLSSTECLISLTCCSRFRIICHTASFWPSVAYLFPYSSSRNTV